MNWIFRTICENMANFLIPNFKKNRFSFPLFSGKQVLQEFSPSCWPSEKIKDFSFHCKNCFSLCKKKIEFSKVLEGAGCSGNIRWNPQRNSLWLPRTSHWHQIEFSVKSCFLSCKKESLLNNFFSWKILYYLQKKNWPFFSIVYWKVSWKLKIHFSCFVSVVFLLLVGKCAGICYFK